MAEVLVIRASDLPRTLAFFETIGLVFVEEKHGNGPVHYACEQNGVVFEIYPSKKADTFRFVEGY